MTQQNLTEHFATDKNPFQFVDSGLDNVFLVGIKYFTSPDGRIVAEIPALKQLMRLIARDLVLSKSDLTGAQVRFLRKRLGKKATEYCKYLGLEPETLSRIENGKQPISSATEKLARLSYAILSEESGLYDHARTILQSMLDELKPTREKIVLEIRRVPHSSRFCDEWASRAARLNKALAIG